MAKELQYLNMREKWTSPWNLDTLGLVDNYHGEKSLPGWVIYYFFPDQYWQELSRLIPVDKTILHKSIIGFHDALVILPSCINRSDKLLTWSAWESLFLHTG